VQPDSEHQENDADFGQLVGQSLIRHIAWRERADQDAGEKISNQWRDAQTMRHSAKTECQNKADDNGRYQRRVMRHLLSFAVGMKPLNEKKACSVNLNSSGCRINLDVWLLSSYLKDNALVLPGP
jgi:hypothetical protein